MSLPFLTEDSRCPVCQARFRGNAACSRCGAALEPLLLLAAQAYALRQAAREALRSGDCKAAMALCRSAQGLQSTPEGALLMTVCLAANSEGDDFNSQRPST